MFCARCGAPCAGDELFCARCGAALQVEGGLVEEIQEEPAAAPLPAGKEETLPARRRSGRSVPRFHRLSHRTGQALTAGVLALLAVLLAVTPKNRPGPEMGPPRAAGLYGADSGVYSGQYIYYDGVQVAGPEEGLILYQNLGNKGAFLADVSYQNYYHLDGDGLTDLPSPAAGGVLSWAITEQALWYINDEGLWRLPYEGGEARLMDPEAASDAEIKASPTGDAAVYAAYGGQDSLELRLCRGGGRITTISTAGGVPVAVSDGGTYVYYLPVGGESANGASYQTAIDQRELLLLWDGKDTRLAASGALQCLFLNWDGSQAAAYTDQGTFLVEEGEVFYRPGLRIPISFLTLSTGWSESLVRTMGDYSYFLNVEDLTGNLFVRYYEDDGSVAVERWDGGDEMETLAWIWTPEDQGNAHSLMGSDNGREAWYTKDDGVYYLDRQGRVRQVLERDLTAEELRLRSVSPDGECLLLLGEEEGMYFLKQDGTQIPLSEENHLFSFWTCFYGVYYWGGGGFFFAPWGETPREYDLGTVRSTQGTDRGVEVTAVAGDGAEQIWHILPGREPILVEEPEGSVSLDSFDLKLGEAHLAS